MWGSNKTPTVKIPSSILKKEAEKIAKKMVASERQKDKLQLQREKSKHKKHRKERSEESWKSFADDHFWREISATAWFCGAILFLVLFWSEASLPRAIFDFFQNIFGLGTWILPVVCAGFGVALFRASKEDQWIFPPARVAALMIFFALGLGIANLFVSQEDSLALAYKYGGGLGFAIGFFPREFLGTFVTAVIFVAGAIISGMIGFQLRTTDILAYLSGKTPPPRKVEKTKIAKAVKADTVGEEDENDEEARFENEVEIIDSTKSHGGNSIDLEEEEEEKDELTEAKKRKMKGVWEPPSLDILKQTESTIVVDENSLREKAEKIREKLEQFGIEVKMKSVHVGPTVTQFTLEPAPGVKLTKITALKNDLALTLAAENIRIEAPIRGKSLVGIEIPNEQRATVGMREILESELWTTEKSPLRLAFGRDVAGKPIVSDLSKMPHLLIAGKTGSGKSVAMNAFLCSLLWQNSPEDLKLILVDPKRVELKPYDKLPHLLTPVIVEPEKCVSALAWAVAEMNRRYRQLAEVGVRNLKEYNEKFPDKKEPLIVIVIDELADLMMVAGKDVEAAICRIAQIARAVGMHLIVATQRPSVDVVTGLIKANLPARIAFKVSSGIDSRTIIDGVGAEDLLGFGDMLYLDGNSGNLTRIQGIYISNEEVERLTNHIKLQFPEMIANDEITNQSIEGMAKGGVLTAGIGKNFSDEDLDPLFAEAVEFVIETGKASASLLQRRMEIGYARAARLLDQMESRKIIGPAKGAKAREIYGRRDE